MVEASPITQHSLDADRDCRLICDIQAHHTHGCTAGNVGERAVGGKNPHAALAQFGDRGTTETTGCARHERNR
jgi:hypothetical protein